jgi:predicted nucleic acid-binding protein
VTGAARAVLDTSVFIAVESGRQLDEAALPAEAAISVVTLAEMHAGVLVASDVDTRARRLATLAAAADIELLVIDEAVAVEWARLRVLLAEAERRANANDLWIAATALTHDLSVVTQDADFSVLEEIGGLRTIPV